MCAVQINEKSIIITGGRSADVYEKRTSIFDFETETWSEDGPNMNHRRTGHGCAKFELSGKQILIVVGGYNSDLERHDKVEFLDLENIAGGFTEGKPLQYL